MRIKLGDGITGAKEVVVDEGATVQKLIADKKLNNQTVICVLNGKVAHPSTRLAEGDELELVGVIYGG